MSSLLQHETIFSVGKSLVSINPCDCFDVGFMNSFDKLNFKILPIEVSTTRFFFSFLLMINESITFILFFNFAIVNVLLLLIISSSNKTFLNFPSEFKRHK